MCHNFLQNIYTRIEPAFNRNYAPTVICVIMMGILSSLFKHNDDMDERNIRKMLERDSRNSTKIFRHNSIIRQSELSAVKKKLEVKFTICITFCFIIISLILMLYIYMKNKDTLQKQAQLTLLKELNERYDDIEKRINQTLFSNKLQMDKTLNEHEQRNNKEFVIQQKKLQQFIYENRKKVEVTVTKNIERIEQIKRGFIDLLETDDELKGTLRRIKTLEKSVSSAEDRFAKKNKEMDENVRKLNTTINKLEDKSENAALEVDKSVDIVKVNCYKSNIQLLNSKILFDTALSKFEVVQGSIKELITGGQPKSCNSTKFKDKSFDNAQKRLERCLEASLQVRKKLEMIECKRDNEMNNSHTLSLVLDEHSLDPQAELSKQSSEDFGYFKIYSDANDLVISDLNDRVNKLERSIQGSKILTSNPVLYETSENSGSEWISAIYGMLNTDIVMLQYHAFGLERLESLNLFEETGHKLGSQYKMVSEFVNICKRDCIKLISSIRIIVLESYLVQNQNDNYIIKECKIKITASLSDIFEWFKKNVTESSVSAKEENSLLEILIHFRKRLTSDLINMATEYLSLFRQHLNDFHTIHDSLGTLKNSSLSSKESQESFDSEVSNFIDESVLSTSSWRDEFDESFKPLKLAQTCHAGEASRSH